MKTSLQLDSIQASLSNWNTSGMTPLSNLNRLRPSDLSRVADEETKRQPYAILRSWIDQLIHNNDEASEIVYSMYKSIETRPPTPPDLWRLFETLGKGSLG